MAISFACLFSNTSRPETASFLNDEEKEILRYGSVARFDLIHSKKMVHHNPYVTQMCCLPVLLHAATPNRHQGIVAGLIIDHKGQDEGHYRRVGFFWCEKQYLDGIEAISPRTDTSSSQWPSVQGCSAEQGCTITLV